jgi:hypothetical protein
MSGLTHRSKTASLFDDPVGTDQNTWRDGDSERPGTVQVDHEIKNGGLFNWQLGRLRPLENAINEIGRAAVGLDQPRTVGALVKSAAAA